MGSVLRWSTMFVVPALLALSARLGGAWVLLVPAFVYGALPLLDLATGPDRENAAPPAPTWVYRALPRIYVPVQLAALAYSLSVMVTAPPLVAAGLLVATAIDTALSINVAHELMHRGGPVDGRLSVLLMSVASYPHFVVEHVFGHHRHVATPLDPASARAGESVYRFLPRTLAGSLKSAWTIEVDRSGSRFGPKNRVVRWWALTLAGVVGLALLSPLAAALFVASGAGAVLLLEVINYVEHYGLHRAEVAPGRYERVRPAHSWNSPERVTNWILLNLQRHSDHHAFAGRPYEQLRHHEDAPQLPAGYPWMMLLALVPAAWFRVMDPRVQAWERAAA